MKPGATVLTSAACILALVACTAPPTSAPPTSTPAPTRTPSPEPRARVTLVGHIDAGHPGFVPADASRYGDSGQALDIAVAGGYAYVVQGAEGPMDTVWGNLCVLDVSNPALPRVAGSFVPEFMAADIVVAGGRAYLTDTRCDYHQGTCHGALYTLDVANPARPVQLGIHRLDGMEASFPWNTTWYANSVAVAGRCAYVTGDPYDGQLGDEYGLCVVDISHPQAPARLGALKSVSSGPPWDGRTLAVSGGYAYIAAMEDGLRVVDVSDPAAPREVDYAGLPGEVRDVAVVGRYAYVAADGAGLHVFDISDPARPAEAGAYETRGAAQSLAVAGHYAYVAAAGARLQVIDISDPARPVEVGYYGTSGGHATGVAVAEGYVYVTDYEEGLFILRFEP